MCRPIAGYRAAGSGSPGMGVVPAPCAKPAVFSPGKGTSVYGIRKKSHSNMLLRQTGIGAVEVVWA
jgi:hypothetical protein